VHKFTTDGLEFVLAKVAKGEETWMATKDGVLRFFKCPTSLTDDAVIALAPEAQIIEVQQTAGETAKKGY
jgi:hypothetical protein